MYNAVVKFEVLVMIRPLFLFFFSFFPPVIWRNKRAYLLDQCRARPEPASDNIDVTRLSNNTYPLTTCDIGKGVVVQPGWVEAEAAIVGSCGMKAW